MTTPNWTNATAVVLDDWGPGKNTIAGTPHASGKILSVNGDGSSECGLWSCTPGTRSVSFAVDEFCYFTAGKGEYVRDDGERIPVSAGTVILFPAGWTGTSIITETLAKAFMCR